MKNFACALLLCWLVTPAFSEEETPSRTVTIGSRLELFADDFLIDVLKDGARHQLHQPKAQEVAIVTDKPWEGNTCAYYSVFQDGDIYRMYYRGSHWDEKAKKAAHREFTCYAESKDGIHWTKPELGLFEFNGSKANNIVLDGLGTHCFVAFRDDKPGVPADARYKGISRGNPGGLYIFKSPDGVRWTQIQQKAVITNGAFDSQNLAFWDPVEKEYRAYWRYFGNGVRSIRTATSSDFVTWSPDKDLKYGAAPNEHLYTNAIRKYPRAPHIYVGFPTRYQPKNSQVEPVFMISRDGVTFRRYGEPLIPITAPKDRDGNRSNYMVNGLIRLPGKKDEFSIWGSEAYYTGPDSRLRRFTIRADGFASVSAGDKVGTLITKPLVFSGLKLNLNFATKKDGYVVVRIKGANGSQVVGEVSGDETAKTVNWSSKRRLSKFAGMPVVMTFELKNADLYSMQFVE
ncbi:MAG: hypothetical protein H8E37_14130 [Planctomycetes bacterium]|nr:hypothetical protein [Planctomycetota bacterium]